ncbi:hypothetical protein LTR78_000340 [Recurvomyces mirabilis]|uniref:Uncharacterized protein n=1 Tax=Recurvomyces mirabilis TaxID=574656 RepID=A0AAE0WXS7_9PEZI|nr:hypothetical protein LTR78_000340 [Recurvomyces mirabilis]KAK5161995.1 hypothetical protein LTS14_000341 [Recurvomyces mirabilis]
MKSSYTKIEHSPDDSEALLTHRTSDESNQRWLDESLQRQARHRQATPRVKVALTGLVVLLMVNIVLSATNLAQWRSRRATADLGLYCEHPCPNMTTSSPGISKSNETSSDTINRTTAPAQVALQPQAKFIDASFGATNIYKGSRSPRLDRAWHGLFENQNIRVTKEELEKANKTSVELADGSGWYGVPDHCIDQLRQEVTCKADVTLIGFEWVPNNTDPSPVFQGWHECKNFEAIDAWAKGRRFDIFEDELLVHPTLGRARTIITMALTHKRRHVETTVAFQLTLCKSSRLRVFVV